MATITDDEGIVYEIVPYETLEEQADGYYATELHGYVLKPVLAPKTTKD